MMRMAYANVRIENLYRPHGQRILADLECYALEKIHGTPAHVAWDGQRVRLQSGGESHASFAKLFDAPALAARFAAEFGARAVVVYGEAHGGHRQGQAWRYGHDLRFVAFDATVEGRWLNVPDAEALADRLGLDFVHYARVPTDLASLDAERDAPSVQARRNGVPGDSPREGVILRPIVEREHAGERVIAKHKGDDDRETASPRPVVDPSKLVVLERAEEIAAEWVTERRMDHVLQHLTLDAPTMRDAVRVMDEMVADIVREGGGEWVDTPEARAAIRAATSKMLKRRVSSGRRA